MTIYLKQVMEYVNVPLP